MTNKNFHVPAEDRTGDLSILRRALYHVAIKAGLYRKAVQVYYIPNLYPVTRQSNDRSLEYEDLRRSLEYEDLSQGINRGPKENSSFTQVVAAVQGFYDTENHLDKRILSYKKWDPFVQEMG